MDIGGLPGRLSFPGFGRLRDSRRKDEKIFGEHVGEQQQFLGFVLARQRSGITVRVHTDGDPGPLPGKDETEELLLFANMLAEYFFILPARIPKPPKPRKRKASRKTAYIH